jgi:hypothetical protein
VLGACHFVNANKIWHTKEWTHVHKNKDKNIDEASRQRFISPVVVLRRAPEAVLFFFLNKENKFL